jgi:hypothetical protein
MNEFDNSETEITVEEYYGDEDYDDAMDGDHDSAMASVGWGSDEDYVGWDDIPF